ncbi:MAG: hypothetical protein LBL81_00795 [Tannerella sp.]|jgi:hypothetical protein|nr:hypothetical protein [Tannerella sp.]
MNKQKYLIVRFKTPLRAKELPLFRGAIIHAMADANVLFHNHTEEGFRYAYPLIQYKRLNGSAAIVCLSEGAEAIGGFFAAFPSGIRLGERQSALELSSVKAGETLVQVWDSAFAYRLTRWLPLNQENYSAYKAMDSLAERGAMLEKILTGNILSFAKGLGIHLDKPIVCQIDEIERSSVAEYKRVKMDAFDLSFRCNVSFPPFIGLGKGVSLGFGTVYACH